MVLTARSGSDTIDLSLLMTGNGNPGYGGPVVRIVARSGFLFAPYPPTVRWPDVRDFITPGLFPAVMIAAPRVSPMVPPSRTLGDGVMDRMAPHGVDRNDTTNPHATSIDRRAEERLRRSSYLALRDVSCLASDGVVYLHGTLPTYYLKQLAQEIAAGVEGVHCVINRIEVFATLHEAPSSREPRGIPSE
jgi:hypothetical protein